MSEFVKLECANDWGAKYWQLPGKALDKNGMASYNRGLKLCTGMALDVKWPDGSISTEILEAVKERGTIGDMGHDYNYTTTQYGFTCIARGMKYFVNLEDVEVRKDQLVCK